MSGRYYPSSVTVSKDAADKAKRDRFHEAAFFAALTGLCANPWFAERALDVQTRHIGKVPVEDQTVRTAVGIANAAIDQYPFITDDEQLTKGKTQ